MAQWYDEDMPGQDDGYERTYYPERFENEEDKYTPENEDYYDIMYRNLREGKNADGSERIEKSVPEIGSRWKHYNGIEYTVLYIANREGGSHYKETVVYQGDNGKVWTRELSDWYRSFSTVV